MRNIGIVALGAALGGCAQMVAVEQASIAKTISGQTRRYLGAHPPPGRTRAEDESDAVTKEKASPTRSRDHAL
jgi:hypothetical protein